MYAYLCITKTNACHIIKKFSASLALERPGDIFPIAHAEAHGSTTLAADEAVRRLVEGETAADVGQPHSRQGTSIDGNITIHKWND